MALPPKSADPAMGASVPYLLALLQNTPDLSEGTLFIFTEYIDVQLPPLPVINRILKFFFFHQGLGCYNKAICLCGARVFMNKAV